MTTVSNYERETIIIYNNEEKIATITTYDPKLIRRLLSNKDATILDKDTEDTRVTFLKATLPKKLISVRESIVREYTAEQRTEMAERLSNARNRK